MQSDTGRNTLTNCAQQLFLKALTPNNCAPGLHRWSSAIEQSDNPSGGERQHVQSKQAGYVAHGNLQRKKAPPFNTFSWNLCAWGPGRGRWVGIVSAQGPCAAWHSPRPGPAVPPGSLPEPAPRSGSLAHPARETGNGLNQSQAGVKACG